MVQNWSFEVQHQLASDLILSVGYVGTHGTRLHSALVQINSVNPKYYPLGTQIETETVGSPAGQATLASLGVTVPSWFIPLYGSSEPIGQVLRPFPQYQGISTALENVGQSTYNALEAKLERRFHNGLNLLASYTYSKTLTDADSALPAFVTFSGGGSVQNSYNLKNEKSLSYQDIPHTLVVSYIYELPVGKGKKFLNKGGITDKVLGGWQIGGVQRYQSGQPISFSCNGGQFGGPISGYDGCIRLDRVPGQPLLSPTASSFDPAGARSAANVGCTAHNDGTFTAPAGVTTYFNCAAFFNPNASDLVTQRGFVFGNMPRITGEVRSQKYFNEDFSIIKRLRLTESQSILLKGELVNAFNRHVFSRPDAGPADGTFGAAFGTTDGSRK